MAHTPAEPPPRPDARPGETPLPPPDAVQPPTHLLYLHGFRSSPLSTKAQHMARWVAEHRPDLTWWCPALPPSPAAALDMVMRGIAHWPADRMAVIGSSLGGYYASIVAARTGCTAALINPAVHPARDLARHIGEQTTWQAPEERFYFQPGYIGELEAIAPPATLPHPERLLAVIATGDEVLDWREMCTRYAGSPTRLIDGGDHALSAFDDHLPQILRFLRLASTT